MALKHSTIERQYSLIFILLIFLNFFGLGLMQKQRVDGGGNSKSNFIQQQQFPRFQQQHQQNQQQYQQQFQQQQQQPKYYSYDNGINDNGRSTQWYYFPQQQQENYFPQQYNPQQNVNQQQFYSYSSPSSTSFASHAHGVPQLQAAQGAGGQYGNSINAIGTESQFQQQSINQFGQQQGGAVQQQLTQFREAGQQTSDRGGGVNSQIGNSNNNQQQQFYSYTTFPPLTLPPHPPTFATMMPSFFPTPPSQPVYDHALAQRMHKQPYLYNFDFAPGTPVIYCAYGANPIPRYNTPYKKCIPYHPLCGITFTVIKNFILIFSKKFFSVYF